MSILIKVEGDTAPTQRLRLKGLDEQPANLVGATVQLWIQGRETPIAVDVVDAEDGVVRAQRGGLEAGARVESYFGKFRVTYADQTVESFPTEGWLRIDVWPDPEGAS